MGRSNPKYYKTPHEQTKILLQKNMFGTLLYELDGINKAKPEGDMFLKYKKYLPFCVHYCDWVTKNFPNVKTIKKGDRHTTTYLDLRVSFANAGMIKNETVRTEAEALNALYGRNPENARYYVPVFDCPEVAG